MEVYVDQATIATRVASGWAKAAAILGIAGMQYRPTNALVPMAAVYGRPMMVFDAGPAFSLARPQNWGVPTEYVILNTTDVSTGDILVCGSGTYFVARYEAMRPPLCVLCTRTVSVSGVTGTTTTVLSDCPAAILLKSHGDRDDSGMPGSTRPGQFVLYLPSLPGVTIVPYMTVVDDLGNSYSVASAEATSFGFRCMITNQQV
jgi:hypothetical protein